MTIGVKGNTGFRTERIIVDNHSRRTCGEFQGASHGMDDVSDEVGWAAENRLAAQRRMPDVNQVLPYFILTKIPAGVAGIVIATVLAAAMSSLDSGINAISTVTVVDLMKPYLAKGLEDRDRAAP